MPNEPIDENRSTPGGQPPERVEDRPNVGTVRPEDYPLEDRAAGRSDAPIDEEKEHERLNPASSGKTPAVAGRRHDRDEA